MKEVRAKLTIPRLTKEQIARQLAALEQAKALQRKILERRGGELLPPSAPDIREARRKRTERL